MDYLIIAFAGLCAFYIKGLMGVGTATVLISITALAIDAKSAIVLTALANIFGGLAMIKIDPVPIKKSFWLPLTLSMLAGSVAGAMALKYISSEAFTFVLGVVFLALSVWFVFIVPKNKNLPDGAPDKASLMDGLVSGVAGFSGGFIGLNVPIKVSYFGRFLNKQYLRRYFVIVYFPAAIAQTLTFIFNGLFTKQILLYGVFLLPGLVAGIYFGNRAHHKVSELWFRRILGTFLLVVSLRLIF